MKPNKENYFNKAKNTYLSNSKIKDFLLDRNFFKRKHIDMTVPDKQSDAMVIGSAVDCILTGGREFYNELYRVVERRNLKDKPIGYTELSPSLAREIEQIVSAVESNSAYKFIKSQKDLHAQEILALPMKLGLFDGLCGIPDWFWIEERKFGKKTIRVMVIVDLKTSRDINPRKYYWAAQDMGYFMQQAMYQYLGRHIYEVDDCESFHLAVEKDENDINNVALFRLDQGEIDQEQIRLINTILPAIKAEKEFKRLDCDWQQWTLLTRPNKDEI